MEDDYIPKSMKPPFSYYGGKQRMASKIIPYIPKHTVYAEPFCGGATLLFRKPWPDVNGKGYYREYINDSNELIYNFFKALTNQGDELVERLSTTPFSEKIHKEYKHLELIEDDLERAIGFFINIQQSFTNQLNGGWARSVYGDNQQAKWAKTRNLFPYIKRMQSVGLACTDALKFIKQYDSPQTFFYCDPPYPNTDQRHYRGYNENNLKDLISVLSNANSSSIVSCYNQDELFDPSTWKKETFKSSCSAMGGASTDRTKKYKSIGRDREEVIYIKKSTPPRKEIQALYDSGKFDCFLDKGYANDSE